MARLYLVRHGRAEAGFGDSIDPPLDSTGIAQAREVATHLSPLGPLAILTSPLARARQTAEPLARLWNRDPLVLSAVAEIPAPTDELQERLQWLRTIMEGSWRDASPSLGEWRDYAIKALLSQKTYAVIFTHFIAINVAVGAAIHDERVVVFSPANCSVTIIETQRGVLELIEMGAQAPLTRVN
ncbi:MAG TPA: histidine phosphatase family protein [Rhizomicrobium sp.]|jgi:broad specificity phosphatase PhoE